MQRMSLMQALIVGAAQVLSAAFPGTSRSMITIAAGQVTGMSRAAALEFSFFLSIPTMFAATGYKLASSVAKHEVVLDGQRWVVLLVGLVVSFLVAWVVVAWFMHWVRRRGFVPFAVYRIILGLIVLIVLRMHLIAG
jgi:undecaprenyl-diphosphatase